MEGRAFHSAETWGCGASLKQGTKTRQDFFIFFFSELGHQLLKHKIKQSNIFRLIIKIFLFYTVTSLEDELTLG